MIYDDRKFAEVYNEAWASFSQKRAQFVLAAIKKRGSVLDVGCGSGNFLKVLEPHFESCVGFDASSAMVEIARLNCRKSDIFEADVLNFDLQGRTFDLVTCNFDMINHLYDLAQYEVALCNIYRHIKDGGEFTFDFNTVYELKYVGQDYIEECGDYTKIYHETRVDKEHIDIRMTVIDKRTNDTVVEVTQRESLFKAEEIEALLKKIGFKTVEFCECDFSPAKTLEQERLYCRCVK